MRAIIALAAKDLRLLGRDRAAVFFTVAFPVLFAAVFGMIYSGMGGPRSAVRIVVVDVSPGPASEAIITRLRSHAVFEISSAQSREEARELVRRGRRAAYVVIPEDVARLGPLMVTGGSATIELGIDPSRTHERAMIEGLVSQAAFEQVSASFQEADSIRAMAAESRRALARSSAVDLPRRAALGSVLGELDRLADALDAADPGEVGSAGRTTAPPIRVATEEVTGRQAPDWHASAFSITFAQGVVWALIGCAASFSMSLVIERSGGTLLRLRAAPLPALHVLAGKAMACIAATLVATAILIGMGIVAFGLRIGNPPMLAAAILASSIAFVGIMMVLAVLGRTPRAAGPLGYAILLSMAILGGGMMPHFMMPAWMQSIGRVSPVKWTVVAVENAVFRGATWGEQALPLGVLLAIGAAGIGIGAWCFARWRG